VPKKKPPQTDAERAAARRAVDARIDAIVTLMEAGKWRQGVSHAEHVAKFGVSIDTAYEDARAAGAVMRRLLTQTPEEREAARARLLADLEEHRAIALRLKKPVVIVESDGVTTLRETKFVRHPDVRAANETLDQRAKVLGLFAPLQLEVTTPPPELERMTLEELEKLDAEIAKRHGVVKARIAALRAKARGSGP